MQHAIPDPWLGPRIGRPGRRGGRGLARRAKVLKTLQCQAFLWRLTELLSLLSEIFDKVLTGPHQKPDCVFSLGNVNVCGQSLL